MAVRTKLFRYKPSKAVRPPEDVVVLREGSRRVIVPVDKVWDDFFDSPGIDFPDRDQPPPHGRDPI